MKNLTNSLILFVLFLYKPPVRANGFEEIYTIIIKKQVKKRQSRWSLASWLAIKETMRLQDQWLALHSSDTTFEGYLGGGASVVGSELNSENLDQAQAPEVNFGFYNRIFGVQGRWVDEGVESGTGMNGSVHLRILGRSVQNSNITVGYGIRERNETLGSNEIKFSNQYAEVSTTLYLFHFLGAHGSYQHFFVDNADSTDFQGHRIEAGVFLDISFTQIYLNYFTEPVQFNNLGTLTESTREGYTGGLRFFF